VIVETAKVVGIIRDKAIITKETSSACEGCHLSGSCMSSGDVRCDKTFIVLNRAGAKVGDRVEVSLTTIEFFVSVLLIYLLPLAFLFAGFIMGGRLAPFLARELGRPVDTTAASVVLGVALLVGSYVFLYAFNRWCREKGLFLPKAIRIIS